MKGSGQLASEWPESIQVVQNPGKSFMALTEIDRNLLNRCLGRETGAWKDFVDRFIGLFIHVINHTAHARSVKITADDIDDLCADVFVTVLADDMAVLRRFRGKSSLATYLTVVARRIVVREIARRRMAEAMGHVHAHQSSLDHAKVSGNHEIKRIEDADQVKRMLEGLSERDASIVRQYHLEGQSYREISKKLDLPENSIGPTLSRAREQLREKASSS